MVVRLYVRTNLFIKLDTFRMILVYHTLHVHQDMKKDFVHTLWITTQPVVVTIIILEVVLAAIIIIIMRMMIIIY